MPSLVISIDAAIIKEVALRKERTTLGRRPYNDIVISNLAVSGEHALLHCVAGRLTIEDLQSTNGTYVNGQRIVRQDLLPTDSLQIGLYQMRLRFSDREHSAKARAAAQPACLRLDGGAGRAIPLVKTVTSLGKPGLTVAFITRQATGFTLARIHGADGTLRLNGLGVGAEPRLLRHGDQLELSGSRLQFLLQASSEATGCVEGDIFGQARPGQ